MIVTRWSALRTGRRTTFSATRRPARLSVPEAATKPVSVERAIGRRCGNRGGGGRAGDRLAVGVDLVERVGVDGVGPGGAADDVSDPVADADVVVAGVAADGVGAEPTGEDIRAVAAGHGVVAGVAAELIGARATAQLVGARTTRDRHRDDQRHRCAVVTVTEIDAHRHRAGRRAEGLDDDVAEDAGAG